MPLPSSLAALSDAFYTSQALTASTVAKQVRRGTVEQAVLAVQSGQRISAMRANAYVALAAGEEGGSGGPSLNVSAFVDDGEQLAVMLRQAAVNGAQQTAAFRLVRLSASRVSEAGQAATSVAVAANEHFTGYYRKLRLPSCKRCAELAGRWYEWNAGFKRHPKCDCVHAPAAKAHGIGFDPKAAIMAGQVTGISAADLQAISEGADVSQVVNVYADGSLYDAGSGLMATTAGTSSRGLFGRASGTHKVAGQRYGRSADVRLTPASIYRLAGDDRDLAIKLLRRYSYVL